MNILVTIVVTLAKWMNFWKNKGLPTPGHSCSRRSQCTTSAIPSPPATSSPPPSLPFALIRASPGHVCGKAVKMANATWHLAASTWTAHPHPHPPSHHLRHHPPLHLLLQGLWQGQLFEYARSICETLAEVTRVSPTWLNNSMRITTEGGGCHCHDRLTAIALRHAHQPPHFHLRARFLTTLTAPTSGQRGAGRRTRTWGSISLATSLRRRDITIHLVEKLYRVLYMGE